MSHKVGQGEWVYYVRRTKANLNSESVTENMTMFQLCLHLRLGICKYIDVMDLRAMIHNSTFGVGINYLVMILGCSTMS